jgi:hypothetical protein
MVAGWGDDLVPIFEAWESEAMDAIAEAEVEVSELVSMDLHADAAMLLTELDCALAMEVWELQSECQLP